MRKLLFKHIALLLLLIASSDLALAQCPSTGCTTTISGADGSPYTINAGQKLCLTATADYTGTITMNGGTLENCASNPQSFHLQYNSPTTSVVINYGTVNFTSVNIDQGVFNNYGTYIETNNIDIQNTAIFNNYDSVYAGNNLVTTNDAQLYNWGSMDVINNFDNLINSYTENYGYIHGHDRFKIETNFYNSGIILVDGLWDNIGSGRTFYNDGGCVTADRLKNERELIGINCGTITIANSSENFATGIIDGDIAIVDNAAFPFVDVNSGFVGASVTGVSCGCPGPAENCSDTISGIVFNDLDADSILTMSDSLLDSVRVELYHDINGNGIIDGADSILTTELTDSTGFYQLNYSSYQTVKTLNKRVSFGEDDSYEDLASGSTKNDDKLKLGEHGALMSVGVRFRDIALPKNAFITNAYIEFDAHDGQTGLMKLAIFGEAEDSADVYADGPLYDISSRAKTIDSVLWDETNNWVQDQKYNSANISSLVQEILDRPGWNPGNPMAFMFEAYTSTNQRNAKDWKEDATKAPLLRVSYIDSALFYDYIVKVDESTLPVSFTYSTDSLHTGELSCGLSLDTNNLFGIVTLEICNDSIDNDGDGLVDCDDITDCVPDTAGTITASNDTICEGVSGESYSIAPVAGATSYDWTVPVGATITAGQGTTTISVNWGNTSGNVCVRSYNGFCYSAFHCALIQVDNVPASPAAIIH